MFMIRHYIGRFDPPLSWYFRTKTLAIAYRNSIVGTDNPHAETGTWTLYRIGPDALPDHALVLHAIASWTYIGRWDDNGNDHRIIGTEEVNCG